MRSKEEAFCPCCGIKIAATSEGQRGENDESGFDVFFIHDYPDDFKHWEHECKEDLSKFDMWFPASVSTSNAYQLHMDNYKNWRL